MKVNNPVLKLETEPYIGTKIINCMPATKGEFMDIKGLDGNTLEDPTEEGYIVIYENNYMSWSPKGVFENAYTNLTEGLSYSHALFLINKGHKLSRKGWNGKNMFVFLVPGSEFKVNRPPLLGIFPEGTDITYRAHLDMVYADGTVGVWLANHSDMLVNDWFIVE